MLRQICCFFSLLAAAQGARAAVPVVAPAPAADGLVEFINNGTITAADANTRIKRLFKTHTPAPTKTAIDLYKVRYRSVTDKGAPTTVTGLVALPRGGATKGLVVFCHGTTGDRAMSPSRFKSTTRLNEAQWAVLAFASGGYGVAMPDYLGLGDDPGAHPYPMWKTNSASAIDIVIPARILAAKKKVALSSPLFLTGYSEGGAVAMWAARTLEAKSLPIAAVAPLSGPYDLSNETRKALLAPAKDITDFAAQLYLLSYTARYFAKNQGMKLTDYMKPTLAGVVSRVFDSGYSDETIIKRLVIAAFMMGVNNDIQKIMTPRFIKAVKDFDTKDPLIRELRNNDCFDWAPRSKMLLVALENDTIVTDANTRMALKTMRSRGVSAATLRDYYIQDANLTHLTAPGTAVAVARKFFDGGFAAVGK